MRRIGQDKGQRLIGMADALSASGITKLVLHAWERRYGMEPAERTLSGRRFYTSEQVERLRLLKTCSDGGYRIGNLVGLPIEALCRIEADLNARKALSEILEAVKAMDSDRLQALLEARAEQDAPEHFIRATALPLMREVGSLWASGEASIAAEHMTTAQIQRILSGLFDRCPPVASDAPRLVATTPEHEEHHIGALVATLLARLRGWNALFLGANLPASEIAAAAHRREVHCVCLSALAGRKAGLERNLRSLRSMLVPEIEIWIGGAAYQALPAVPGVRYFPDLEPFLAALEAILPVEPISS
jgi:methanogenic corrinoid protein MtbC1